MTAFRTCAGPTCLTRLRSTKPARVVLCDACEAREREAARLEAVAQHRVNARETLAESIPRILSERGPLYARQLVEATGADERSIRRALVELIGRGQVEKAGLHRAVQTYQVTVREQLSGEAA